MGKWQNPGIKPRSHWSMRVSESIPVGLGLPNGPNCATLSVIAATGSLCKYQSQGLPLTMKPIPFTRCCLPHECISFHRSMSFASLSRLHGIQCPACKQVLTRKLFNSSSATLYHMTGPNKVSVGKHSTSASTMRYHHIFQWQNTLLH